MQKIIEETREKLIPFTGSASIVPFSLPKPTFQYAPPPEPHAGRLVRKIPEPNYGKLGKFLPISWL